jgi:hypothetical protein
MILRYTTIYYDTSIICNRSFIIDNHMSQRSSVASNCSNKWTAQSQQAARARLRSIGPGFDENLMGSWQISQNPNGLSSHVPHEVGEVAGIV